MFNIGGMELVVVGLVAVVVLGPKGLPGALRQAGNLIGKARQLSAGFHTDLTSVLAAAEVEAEPSRALSVPPQDDPSHVEAN